MAGFFDLTDPDNAALLGAASGLLQAGAPSRLPMPLGLALARGLQGGMYAELGRRGRQAAAAAMHRRLALGPGAPFGGGGTSAPWPAASEPFNPYGLFPP